MTYQVVIEGQTIPVPEEIGASDEAVKAALTPFYPEAANAMLTRVVKDDLTTVTVVKRAGTKGLGLGLPRLLALPESKNPAVALFEELSRESVDAYRLLEVDARVDHALEEGEKQAAQVEHALKRLQAAQPVPSAVVVFGF